MKPKEKSAVQGIALERIYRLAELAGQEFSEHPERSKDYAQLIKRIGMRCNVKIPSEVREKFCKKCFAFLKPGVNAEVRVKEKGLVVKCRECGAFKKIKLEKPEKKLVIGITGSLGTGKTAVLKEFGELGAETIQADEVAKELLEKKPKLRDRIKRLFGEKVFKGPVLQSKKLGEIVFTDYGKLRKLNALVHPEVKKELRRRIKAGKKKVVAVEVPLLFESRMKGFFDLVVVVWSEKEKQLQRMKKKGLSEKEALKRINAQMRQAEKKRRGNIIIENNKGVKELKKKAFVVWNEVVEEFN